jgi:hypothetical protein
MLCRKWSIEGPPRQKVEATIHEGNPEPPRKERVMFRKNFAFNSQWRVAPVVAERADRLVVVTVFVYYF